jgi:hypothetical protein
VPPWEWRTAAKAVMAKWAGKNGTSVAARRPLEVGELRKTREYLPPNVSWKLNVLYDAPCARRKPVRRRGGDRLAGIHRPPTGTRADRAGLRAVQRACACSDQLHVPLTTGPTDSSQSQRPQVGLFSGKLRRLCWAMISRFWWP